jgi:hypothetical protein
MQKVPQAPAAGKNSASPPATSSVIVPNTLGAIVPSNRKFVIRMPSLLGVPAGQPEISKAFRVQTMIGEPILQINLLRHAPGIEDVVIEEYFSISLPDDIDKELVVCTFGKPQGYPQCEIHKSDAWGKTSFFGVVREDTTSSLHRSGAAAYTLFAAEGNRLLSVIVKGQIEERKLRVVEGSRPTNAVAAATSAGHSRAASDYQVECYPHSDVILTVIFLAAVDRLAVTHTVDRKR